MFTDNFEQATILRTGPDGLTRVIVVRSSWAERESIVAEPYEAQLIVLRRWCRFHQEVLGFEPTWGVASRWQ